MLGDEIVRQDSSVVGDHLAYNAAVVVFVADGTDSRSHSTCRR